MRKVISVVIPCFNEEANIEYAYSQVRKVFSKIPSCNYEIILVDNCSTDSSPKLIRQIAKKDKNVVAAFLSRNFGGEYSSLAGMQLATGDATTVLDCDLQDPPELLPKFILEWEKGSEVVIGSRLDIDDSYLMRLVRKFFYKIFKLISNIEIPINVGTYSLVDKRVMEIIKGAPEDL